METDIETAFLLANHFEKGDEYRNEYCLIGRPLIDTDGNYLSHLPIQYLFVAPHDNTKEVFSKFIDYKDNDTALQVTGSYRKKVTVFLVHNTKYRTYSNELDIYIEKTGIFKEYFEQLKSRLNII